MYIQWLFFWSFQCNLSSLWGILPPNMHKHLHIAFHQQKLKKHRSAHDKLRSKHKPLLPLNFAVRVEILLLLVKERLLSPALHLISLPPPSPLMTALTLLPSHSENITLVCHLYYHPIIPRSKWRCVCVWVCVRVSVWGPEPVGKCVKRVGHGGVRTTLLLREWLRWRARERGRKRERRSASESVSQYNSAKIRPCNNPNPELIVKAVVFCL